MYNPAGRRDLTNQNYMGQDLRGKNDFIGADLRGANFAKANLRNVDFSGAEIQGANFHCANLSEANFSHVTTDTDSSFPQVNFSNSIIKGTNFSNAHLCHADFNGAQTGLTQAWAFILCSIHIFLCLISAFTATISITFLIHYRGIFSKKLTFFHLIFIGVFSILLVIVLRTLLLNYFPILLDPSIKLGIIAIVIVFIVSLVTAAVNEEEDFKSSFMIGILLFTILMITRNTSAFSSFEGFIAQELGEKFLNSSGNITLENTKFFNTNGRWISMVLSSTVGAIFGSWFSWSAITENTQFYWLWKLYIDIVTYGGTLFNNSDLTDAEFISATLKGANFKNAVIRRTLWGGVKSLDKSRVGNSYLKYSKVRELILGRRLRNIIFDNLNLEGINLESMDLSDASFVATNLKFASLRASNLMRANLQQAKLNGADLSNSSLTGACLQDWTIDEYTNLDDIKCDYIFLEELPERMAGRRRHPPLPKNYRPGEFERFFRKDSSVLELLIRGEDDRNALSLAFQQLVNQEHCQFLGLELIGDDAFVKFKAPDNVDTSLAESKFYQKYKSELREDTDKLEQDLRPDEQESFRNFMFKILELVAGTNRTINVNGNYIESNNGCYSEGDIININTDITKASVEIEELIDRLKKNGAMDNVAQKQVAEDIATLAEKNQSVKQRLSQWGISLASATVSDVVKGVIKLACRSAGIPL